MNFVVFKPLKTVFLWSLLLLLAACSTTESPLTNGPSEVNSPYYVASVDITETTTEAELQALYDAEVISLMPDAGFAVLGFSKEAGELTSLATNTNTNAIQSGVTASGFSSWANGHSAWASGFSAWAGGFSAWAGGFSAWAGGQGSNVQGSNQQAWDLINLPEAHAISRNLGEGVVVAVIDTGMQTDHPMFEGRLVNSGQWKDFVGNDSNPSEVNGTMNGHGTAVAGIVLQVAPKAKILPIRVLKSDGQGDLDNVIKAIEWAVLKGADVINLSLGTTQDSYALYQMVKWANDQGVYVVSSAGNEGSTNGILYPGAYSWHSGTYAKTLGISSIDNDKELSSFSNTGGGMFAAAPGRNIASATTGSLAAAFTGTSFAAPLYTGTLALAIGELKPNQAPMDSLNLWGNLTFNDGFRRINAEQLIRSIPNWEAPKYQIYNASNGKCLDVHNYSLDNGGNIKQQGCHSGDNQKWRLEPTDLKGYFKIIGVQSGKVLDVAGINTDAGANVLQWNYNNSNNQKWQLRDNGNGFNLSPKHSNKCLDVQGNSTADGANIQQWHCNDGNAQRFKLRLMN